MVVVVVIMINAVKKDNIKKNKDGKPTYAEYTFHLGLKGAYCKTGMRG